MAKRSRNHSVGFMVDDQEAAMLKSKQEQSGLTLREFMMKCIRRQRIVVKPGGREVVIELKRIGNNLNQITHAVNAGKIYDCTRLLEAVYRKIYEVKKQWE